MSNVNTKDYWDNRFSSGDWENKKGRYQTKSFALGYIKYLPISKDFTGTIMDFGCALGDSIPCYHNAFPLASLKGMDISSSAVDMCREKYGEIAEFYQGECADVPSVDIIIASNVFEHLSNDQVIAESLLKKCKQLIVIVPYRENLQYNSEHINTYTMTSFPKLNKSQVVVYSCHGWSYYGLTYIKQILIKNIIRPFIGKKILRQPKQIMYVFENLDKI